MKEFSQFLILAALAFLFAYCNTGSSDHSETGPSPESVHPKNGTELIEVVVRNSSLRFSFSESDQDTIREIFRETYMELYGNPHESISPEKVRDMKRTIFIESVDRLNEYLDEQAEKE